MLRLYFRLGTEVLWNTDGGRRPAVRTPGIIVGLWLTRSCRLSSAIVQTDGQLLKKWVYSLKFSRESVLPVEERVSVWLRRDLSHVKKQWAPPAIQPFLLKEPEGPIRQKYNEIVVHRSHLPGIQCRLQALQELEKDLAEMREELDDYGRFLKWCGGVPEGSVHGVGDYIGLASTLKPEGESDDGGRTGVQDRSVVGQFQD